MWTWCDGDDVAHCFTHCRKDITKLKKNPAVTLLSEGVYGSTAWAEFEMPKDLITYRTGKKTMSPEAKAKAAERMKGMRGV